MIVAAVGHFKISIAVIGGKHSVFGKSNLEELALRLGITNVARLPIDPRFAALCDGGQIEKADVSALAPVAEAVFTK